jgi:5-formyltetrahydrofolate cyclo-ligase
MTAADVPSEKRQLRRLMRERLVEVLTRARIWSASSSLAAFASKLDEIDCSPLVERALAAGKPVRLPRTTDSGGLEFVAICHLSQLRTGRFGLMEPGADMPAVSLAGDALVVVPGLAFDRLGGRLGRGRGYYDRALAALRHRDPRPLLIGIGYSFQIIDHVPMTRLDARLDGVVSEAGLCECEASRGRWAGFGRGTGRSDER